MACGKASVKGLLLHNPPQLACLVVGELPGSSEELCPGYWALLIVLKIVKPRHELGSLLWLPIHHPKAGFRHRDDDVVVPHFDSKVSAGHRFLVLTPGRAAELLTELYSRSK